MRKSFFAFLVAHLCLVALPLSVLADECDDMANNAKSKFHEAQAAQAQEDYDRAIKLFEEAGGYYQTASRMKNCNCPLIERSATNNVEICRNNVVGIRKQIADKTTVDSFNQGVLKFNEGNTYARDGQWALAANSFNEAEIIWRGIDPSSGQAGKNAQLMAEQAKELLQKARQQM